MFFTLYGWCESELFVQPFLQPRHAAIVNAVIAAVAARASAAARTAVAAVTCVAASTNVVAHVVVAIDTVGVASAVASFVAAVVDIVAAVAVATVVARVARVARVAGVAGVKCREISLLQLGVAHGALEWDFGCGLCDVDVELLATNANDHCCGV